jgi:hypothetical protein
MSKRARNLWCNVEAHQAIKGVSSRDLVSVIRKRGFDFAFNNVAL